jgi:hypothetical protein
MKVVLLIASDIFYSHAHHYLHSRGKGLKIDSCAANKFPSWLPNWSARAIKPLHARLSTIQGCKCHRPSRLFDRRRESAQAREEQKSNFSIHLQRSGLTQCVHSDVLQNRSCNAWHHGHGKITALEFFMVTKNPRQGDQKAGVVDD